MQSVRVQLDAHFHHMAIDHGCNYGHQLQLSATTDVTAFINGHNLQPASVQKFTALDQGLQLRATCCMYCQ